MFEIYRWLVLIAATFFTSFGIFAYFKNRKELTNKLFGLLSLFFALWSFFWFAMLLVKNDPGWALMWARLLNMGAILIPAVYLHWILSIFGLNKQKKLLLFSGYLFTAAFFLLGATDKIVSGIHSVYFFPFWPTAGPYYLYYLIFGYFGMVGYALYLIIANILKTSGERRLQLVYILIGSVMGFGGGAANFLLMYDWEFPPIGIFFVISAPLVLNYAVLKHHLMDLKVIGAEMISVLLGVVLFIDAAMSQTPAEYFIKFLLLGMVIVFSVLLVRSVLNEIKSKVEMAQMAYDLKAANIELQQLDKTKSEFISIVSHQLRTPLTAIKGFASLILEGTYGQLSDVVKDKVQKMFDSSERLIRLVNDMLDLTHMENGKISYEYGKVNLSAMAQSVFDELSVQAQKKNLKLEIAKPPSDVWVWADEQKLRQVVMNITDNSIKYTKEGEVKISLEEKDGFAVYSVKDTGMGIKPNEIAQLFQKFVRGTNASQIHTEGTGVGLYVAKKLIEEMKGQVWAESPGEGKGSAFFIKMPAMKTDSSLNLPEPQKEGIASRA